MKKILFIYNPNSGKGIIRHKLSSIRELYESEGHSLTIYGTSGHLDAERMVKLSASAYDLVVCAGGDGTLSEVVAGMMQSPVRVPIGFIPVGSTNDTRTGFNIPRNHLDAARLCITGKEFKTDIGKFNNDYFTYVASLGSLSAVSCFTPQEMKRIFGHGAYLIEGIKQLIRMDSYDMKVEFDDQVIEGNYFLGMITNSLSVGGFQGITGVNVDLQDGLFEVALLKKPVNLSEFSREIDQMLIHNDINRAVLDDVVVKFRASKVRFTSIRPIQWVRDGENGGKHNCVEIEVCKQAITIITGN